MEISKSISFLTEDPRWQQKLLIGTGVAVAATILSPILIGILGFLIILGYCVRLLQNVRDGHPYPMPEWDQWGDDLARGFKLAVVYFVWIIPGLFLSIPSVIGGNLIDQRSEVASTFGGMLLFCGGCLSLIYGLFVMFATPGFTIAFAKDERIQSGLQIRDIWTWTQANIGQVVVVTLIYIVASIGLAILGSIVGLLLCLVGLIITLPLASLLTYLLQAHLYGQLAYSYPLGGSTASTYTPSPAVYTPPSEMNPGVTPTAPVVPPAPPADTAATTDYPESGIDNPPPAPPAPPAA